MAVSTTRLPAYKNMLVVGGVLLILLGIGNWLTGAVRSRPYAEYLSLHPGPRRPSPSVKAELLAPLDEERQERDVARAKLEFYQLVQSGGRFMVLFGCICLLGGWAARKAPRYPNLMPRSRS